LKEQEDKRKVCQTQLAGLTAKIDNLAISNTAFQDYAIEMIQAEVKGLRKKTINAQMEMK
jgi:hypothetical protein